MTENPLSTVEPWNLVAAGYRAELVPIFSKWARDSFARVSPRPEHRVIDVACGPGTVSLLLAPQIKEVVALDFSAGMIAELQKALDEKGIGNVRARECDCQALDEADRQFDLAFSQFGLIFFPDPDAGLAELYRVLKPGGKVAVYSWAPLSESFAMRLALKALWTGFPHLRPADEEPRPLIDALSDREMFAEKLKAAGFEQVSIEAISHSFPATSARDYWQGMLRSSAPISLLKKNTPPEEWQAGEARALAYLEEVITGPLELESTALLGVGTRPAEVKK